MLTSVKLCMCNQVLQFRMPNSVFNGRRWWSLFHREGDLKDDDGQTDSKCCRQLAIQQNCCGIYLRKLREHSVATALASNVFPVPGGPYSKTPDVNTQPKPLPLTTA